MAAATLAVAAVGIAGINLLDRLNREIFPCTFGAALDCSLDELAEGEVCKRSFIPYKDAWYIVELRSSGEKTINIVPNTGKGRPYLCVSQSSSIKITGTNYPSPLEYFITLKNPPSCELHFPLSPAVASFVQKSSVLKLRETLYAYFKDENCDDQLDSSLNLELGDLPPKEQGGLNWEAIKVRNQLHADEIYQLVMKTEK